MSQTAVLVWLSASSVLPTFRADLTAFAQARLLRLEAPSENAAAYRASAYAPDAVAQLESSLEEARNAAAALEQGRALAALDHAERVLREHAELPQSSWLMAEILELSADVESTAPEGADAARTLRRRAAALEGSRAAPFSDRARAEDDLEPEPTVSVEVQGLEPGDALEWDGMQRPAAFSTTPGEHHARVARNGRLMWAGWPRVATITGASAQVRLPVPETIACSPDDIGQSRFVSGRALPVPHARCDSYVLARSHALGGIEVALCERASCGAIVLWQRQNAALRKAAEPDKKQLWPYALAVSAGVLAITGVVLWRSGAFDRPEAATHEAWVYAPQKTAGFRF